MPATSPTTVATAQTASQGAARCIAVRLRPGRPGPYWLECCAVDVRRVPVYPPSPYWPGPFWPGPFWPGPFWPGPYWPHP